MNKAHTRFIKKKLKSGVVSQFLRFYAFLLPKASYEVLKCLVTQFVAIVSNVPVSNKCKQEFFVLNVSA